MSGDRDTPGTGEFDAALSGDLMTVAKFQTTSCVVCRRLDPGLTAVAGRMADKLRVIDVDADASASLADRYNVQTVPTLILFKDGIEVSRCTGFQSANMLRDWIAPHLDA